MASSRTGIWWITELSSEASEMPQVATTATNKLMAILTGSEGIPAAVTAFSQAQNISLAAVTPVQIVAQNVAPDLSERSTFSNYPLVYVYCGKVINQLREKFRKFSGNAEMVIEFRISQDRLDDMQANLQSYIDAVTQVLDDNRGDWGDGVFFSGGYELTFGAVKHGGRNFLQLGKVSLVLEISTD
jgi:hypothetical protein